MIYKAGDRDNTTSCHNFRTVQFNSIIISRPQSWTRRRDRLYISLSHIHHRSLKLFIGLISVLKVSKCILRFHGDLYDTYRQLQGAVLNFTLFHSWLIWYSQLNGYIAIAPTGTAPQGNYEPSSSWSMAEGTVGRLSTWIFIRASSEVSQLCPVYYAIQETKSIPLLDPHPARDLPS